MNKESLSGVESQLIRPPKYYPYLWVEQIFGHARPDKPTGTSAYKINAFLSRLYASQARDVCIQSDMFVNLVYYATKTPFPISSGASDEGEEPVS